jgi:hypothetical protein
MKEQAMRTHVIRPRARLMQEGMKRRVLLSFVTFVITATTVAIAQNDSAPPLSGSGDKGFISMWTTDANLGDSALFQRNKNIGLGTTFPVTATGGRVLDIQNLGPSVLRLGDQVTVGGTQWEFQSTVINNKGAMNLSNLSTGTNPLTVLRGGNVGINTTSPSNRLTVVDSSPYPLLLQSASSFGTWAKLNNTGAGGHQWNILSAGADNSEGAGNLGITDLTGASTIWLEGNVNVTGNLSKGGGSFRIDHPLDPANKYLSHSFVESPDMMDVYNGNVVTDKNGVAIITLPDYFQTLNRDFRYQTSVVGQFAQAIVAKKVADNHFTIKTSKPGVEVSWQITGIRQDAYANAHRIPVEEGKTAQEQGRYLHPELFGAPKEQAIGMYIPARATTASGQHEGTSLLAEDKPQ